MKKINIGDRFGRLTVIRETTIEERTNPAGRNYECLCDCGNTIIVYGHNLKTGNTKSCGCLSRETARKNNTIDIPIGTRFGKLVVIARAETHKNHQAYWICQCDCGNICEVMGSRLRSGETTSCGCNKYSNLVNEIGNKYGLLTVIEYAGSRHDGGGALWKCQCECGNTIIVRGCNLRSGHTKSCGCIKSWQEHYINELLNKYKITYSSQVCFPDLKTNNGGYLRFDFGIYENNTLKYLIEYQGEQHTDSTNKWYSESYQQRDIQKIEYCKINNIPLLIWDKDTNLEEEIRRLYV